MPLDRLGERAEVIASFQARKDSALTVAPGEARYEAGQISIALFGQTHAG